MVKQLALTVAKVTMFVAVVLKTTILILPLIDAKNVPTLPNAWNVQVLILGPALLVVLVISYLLILPTPSANLVQVSVLLAVLLLYVSMRLLLDILCRLLVE